MTGICPICAHPNSALDERITSLAPRQVWRILMALASAAHPDELAEFVARTIERMNQTKEAIDHAPQPLE